MGEVLELVPLLAHMGVSALARDETMALLRVVAVLHHPLVARSEVTVCELKRFEVDLVLLSLLLRLQSNPVLMLALDIYQEELELGVLKQVLQSCVVPV